MQVHTRTPKLQPAQTAEEYQLHCDAVEWSLAESIIIDRDEDIKSRLSWQGRVSPFLHQVQNLVRFCRRLPVVLLADDVGLGKTISAGLILSELMARRKAERCFVICPKILMDQWVEELGAKFNIPAVAATGNDLRKSGRGSLPVVVTTYQSATDFLKKLEPGAFDMLILDEAHKVRNLYGTKQPPKFATAIHKALEQRMFKYTLMLTATPIQNRLWDIYSLVDCLAAGRGHKNPFGTPTEFSQRYIDDVAGRRLNTARTAEFRSHVGSYMFRTRRADAKLAFPERQVGTYLVRRESEELQIEAEIANSIDLFNGLTLSSVLVAMMSSPAALARQLQNMTEKNCDYRLLAKRIAGLAERVSVPAKMRCLLGIIDRLRSENPVWRMVVFTTRKETQAMIGRILAEQGIRCGFIVGGQAAANQASIGSFRADPPQVQVIVSTDAGAEGVNLQVANILVNYDLPWNPMIVEQRIGRVQRIGSAFRNVWVTNVVHENSPEQHVVGRLMEKLQVIAHTVGDIEAVLDAGDDLEEENFEARIRDMVVQALKGHDISKAAELAEKSIESGRRMFEEQREEMDLLLGQQLDEASGHPPMPKLAPKNPRTSCEELVLSALRQEGGHTRETENGLWRVDWPNEPPQYFTFSQDVWNAQSDEGVFMGKSPLLYQPGKASFERLVQRWVDRSGAILQSSRTSEDQITESSRIWIESLEKAELVQVDFESTDPHFSGEILCRMKAGNSVDSYEKVSVLKVGPAPEGALTSLEPTPSQTLVSPAEVIPGLAETLVAGAEADQDIRRFTDYYSSRLQMELEKSDNGKLKAKLTNDLAPVVSSEVVGVRGIINQTNRVNVTFRVDGHDYQQPLSMFGIRIVDPPPLCQCPVTRAMVPAQILQKCYESGLKVLPHLLIKSGFSQMVGQKALLAACDETGTRCFPSEMVTCSVTGKRVLPSLTIKSGISGGRVLKQWARSCEITAAEVLPDELVKSEVSGKWFRKDQQQPVRPDGRIVHRSEAGLCDFSGEYYPLSEMAVSQYSNRRCPSAKLVRSRSSGLLGHSDEMVQCEKSGGFVHLREASVCAVSGRTVSTDLMERCAVSGQSALPELMKTCAETGRLALPGKLERCQISGADVLPRLLETSAVSGQKARKSLMVKCELTGCWLFPDERGTCGVSGKMVNKQLLGLCQLSGVRVLPEYLETSDASRRKARHSLMVKCDFSGNWLFPDEAEECGQSGRLTDKRLLVQCAATQKRIARNLAFQSALSEKWFSLEFAFQLPDGRTIAKGEAGYCHWAGDYLLKSEIRVCSLCGLSFNSDLLNSAGELTVLRELLDGTRAGHLFPNGHVFLAGRYPELFSGVHEVHHLSSRNNRCHVLVAKSRMLGIFEDIYGLILIGPPDKPTLRGNVVRGKRRGNVWKFAKILSTSKAAQP